MKDFTLLAIFTLPHEYAILRLLLDQEGIRYVFQNETMIGVFPFYSNALGGIKLKVHKEDLERSKEILKSLDDTSTPLRLV